MQCRQCFEDALDRNKLQGKILLCNDSQNFQPMELVAIGSGVIHISDEDDQLILLGFSNFPGTTISTKDAPTVIQYLNSTR